MTQAAAATCESIVLRYKGAHDVIRNAFQGADPTATGLMVNVLIPNDD
jgi:hypothetical protein